MSWKVGPEKKIVPPEPTPYTLPDEDCYWVCDRENVLYGPGDKVLSVPSDYLPFARHPVCPKCEHKMTYAKWDYFDKKYELTQFPEK